MQMQRPDRERPQLVAGSHLPWNLINLPQSRATPDSASVFSPGDEIFCHESAPHTHFSILGRPASPGQCRWVRCIKADGLPRCPLASSLRLVLFSTLALGTCARCSVSRSTSVRRQLGVEVRLMHPDCDFHRQAQHLLSSSKPCCGI